MVKTYQNRQEESSKRLQLRSASSTFTNVIHVGTNCSHFESQLITQKALEIYQLGEYGDQNNYQSGQMKWRAISESEPPGKKLSECKYIPIKLTVHHLVEDMQVFKEHGRIAKRGQQIQRMTSEALEQRTLLTVEDLAMILDCDEKTIRMDIKKFQQKYNILVPTRGNKKDIGPGITHKEKSIELFIEGKDALAIARQMQHSLKAIERYISTFCRVVYCQQKIRNTLKTALVIGISVALVNKYLEIKAKYWNDPEYQNRIEEIEKTGEEHWENQDSKKKYGLTERRRK